MSIKSDKYNYLFSNVIPNSIEGIKIFSKDDDYIKNQKYNNVSNIENQIWSELFQNLNPLLSKYASKAGVLAPPNPVAVPEFAIVTPDGIVIVSPLVPSVSVVPVAGST